MKLKVDQTVIHPQHGAVKVTALTDRKVRGTVINYVRLETAKGMRLMIPADQLDDHGIRQPMSDKTIKAVKRALIADTSELLDHQWRKRMQVGADLMATGDPQDLTIVVRDLGVKLSTDGLSASERDLYKRARRALESELAVVLEGDDAAAAVIDDAIASHDEVEEVKQAA